MRRETNELEKILGIKFKKGELIREALTHRSTTNEKTVDWQHNERLEFLGDAVLELAVSEMLFNEYPDFPEGDLTSFRAALVKTESLAEEAKRLTIGEFLYLSIGEESTGGRERPYILANAMEAIIGAIYLDKGYQTAYKFIEKNIFYKVHEIVEKRLDIDAKSKLQEKAQEVLKITPTYRLIRSEGPDHNKVFTMGAMLGEILVAEGSGESKQSAEQVAAQNTLDRWEEIISNHFSEASQD
ncbi:MAG: ribonuclease III [Candidatus Dojkabacteria bacterium]